MTYIKIEFLNTQPLRIADDSRSQSGQTETLSYIPGSTIRGAVIGEFIREHETDQDTVNHLMSEKVCFLNAYPQAEINGKTIDLLPSVKGFYEDKKDAGDEKKDLQNVLKNGTVSAGLKRASLGNFGCFEDHCFYYTVLEKDSDLKINLGREKGVDQNVFRSQYICSGYRFASWIRVPDEKMKSLILSLLHRLEERQEFILGNARSSGMGRCRILSITETETLPYETGDGKADAAGEVYMILLSDTAMYNAFGENAGIDLQTLREKTGKADLQIEFCSTSIREIRGYNRKWKTKIPSVKMYEKGSVFKFVFNGTIPRDVLQKIEEEGLGVRKNEGYGRVLFLQDYAETESKKSFALDRNMALETTALSEEDRTVLKIAARGILQKRIQKAMEEYLLDPSQWKGKISKSQVGTVRALLSQYQFDPAKAIEQVSRHMQHDEEKTGKQKRQKARQNKNVFHNALTQVFEQKITDLLPALNQGDTAFGYKLKEIFTENEIQKMKIELLIRQMSKDNREERAGR